MNGHLYDLVVIGGGVNGCGIARDAAGRGLSVLLLEKGGLASGTSSASTKLVHGGLRYLEQFEFRLVRESLTEREVLLQMAPHIVRPMRFVLPHHRDLRPAWLIRLGLFLYDTLGKRSLLSRSRYLNLRSDEVGAPLKAEFTRGFEYSDCWVDDARLVVLNAMDAARYGARVSVHTEVRNVTRSGAHWDVHFVNRRTEEESSVAARVVVNAAGPWISQVITERMGLEPRMRTRLVKGSHVVVPRLFTHQKAYIFQNADRRIIFSIPYESDYTLIGTTDVDYHGDPDQVAISKEEIAYLCACASEYFAAGVNPDDVVWSYSGLRPLYDDGESSAQETTRDYLLDLVGQPGEPALLNVFGGKITTYRHLAEQVLATLSPWLPAMGKPWTYNSKLPGGAIDASKFDRFLTSLRQEYPGLDSTLVERLARTYGTLAREVLADVDHPEHLGLHFGANLYEREVRYLIEHEWATSAEDILWRRTKLGLRLNKDQVHNLTDWIRINIPQATAPSA